MQIVWSEMRPALLTPYYDPPVRGNAVTVQRLERQLLSLGCRATVWGLDIRSPAEIIDGVATQGCDICHAFHALLGGALALQLKKKTALPYLVTLTGSDIYESLAGQQRSETIQALLAADRLVVFHESIAARLAAEVPQVAGRIRVIPQGVDLPPMETPGERHHSDDDTIVFLLPAGLRPVKNVLSCLEPLAGLHAHDPRVRLVIAGPAIDDEYASCVLAALPAFPFASYIGTVDHPAMTALYRQASVVLNTSRFEGGMANSLLEAMASSRPVLVADIEGNRSLVNDGYTGLFYRDAPEFLDKAKLLLDDPALRQRLGNAGRRLVEDRHSPEREAAAYLGLYKEVLAAEWTSADF